MNRQISRGQIVLWAPRVLTIFYAAFISLFSADAFTGGFTMQSLLAFAIHLIPTGAVLLLLWLSWKREWVGSMAYAVLGGSYIYSSWGRFPLSVYFLISGPLFVISALFLLSWRAHIRAATLKQPKGELQ